MDELVFADELDRRIAALVLEGKPNKAIATATGLPEGTVKWRLHRLYAQLGVQSRTQFALALSRRAADELSGDDTKLSLAREDEQQSQANSNQ